MCLLPTLLLLLTTAICFDPLITPDASPEAMALYQRLIQLYDKTVISGQTTFNYDDFVAKTAQIPMVRGFDMQNYSPHNPWFNWQPTDDGSVQKAIDWYHSTQHQGIVTFFWHWFSPSGGQLRTSTFYTKNTDFNLSAALIPGTNENTDTLRDLAAIATQLQRLRDSRVPVLWRPLHEAGGRWFWWGSQSSAEAKKLYRLMFDQFTKVYQLNNLIWVWSTPEPSWYPGHLLVDILGFDSYPGAYNYGCRQDVYFGLRDIVKEQKLIYLTENGPIPEMEACLRQGVRWGMFLTWNQLTFSQNSMQHIKDIYNSPFVTKLGVKQQLDSTGHQHLTKQTQ